MASTSSRDRRQFGRRWWNVHAWICLEKRRRVACRVSNLSDGGALLTFDEPVKLPLTFHLVIEAADIEVDCEVRHERRGRAGVRFIVPERIDAAGTVERTERQPRSA